MNTYLKKYTRLLASVCAMVLLTATEGLAQGPWTLEFSFNSDNYRRFIGWVDGVSVNIPMFERSHVLQSTTGNISGTLYGSSEESIPVYYTPDIRYTRTDYENGYLKFHGALCAAISYNCPSGVQLFAACTVSSGRYGYTWEVTDNLTDASAPKVILRSNGTANIAKADLPGLNVNGYLFTRVIDEAVPGAVSPWTPFRLYDMPATFNVSGGGVYCPGSAGHPIVLSGSEQGITYQLKVNGADTGAVLQGTGGALTWSDQTTPGRFTAIATHSVTKCTQLMNESAVIDIARAPAKFTLTGGGTYCPGSEPVKITLSGSQADVSYQLLNNGVAAGSAVAGVQGMLTWNDQTVAGTYTVKATDQQGCTSVMNETVSVTVPANATLPVQYTVGGGGFYCEISGAAITLSDSEQGVNYNLTFDLNGHAYPVAQLLNGTGSALAWQGVASSGAFRVRATNATTGCNRFMNGSATLELNTVQTDETFLDAWAFQYKHDEQRRLIAKKVPGADWVYMIYDDKDRLVMTQDGNQRQLSPPAWTFTKYDVLNRPVLTGIYRDTEARGRQQLQTDVNTFYTTHPYDEVAGSAVHGYSNRSFPDVSNESDYLTVTYYDRYTFLGSWVGEYAYSADLLSATAPTGTYTRAGDNQENTNVTGFITGTKVKVLDGGVSGGYTWLKSVSYYDDKHRVIQTKADNYKGGIDRISTLYDFMGNVLKTKTTHEERDITWQNVVGAGEAGNTITRTAPGDSWTASGAASVQQLAAGQSGWVEAVVSELTTNRMIGLASSNPDVSYTSLDYALYLDGANLRIYENGAEKAAYLNVLKSGDVLRIERAGTAIKYYRNASEVTPPGTRPLSTTALMVDISLYSAGGTLTGVRSSFSTSSKYITRTFAYDHAGRLTHTWHKVDNGPDILLAKNEYNELGQLIDKKLHSTDAGAGNARQSVDYRYNIRGWLTSINNSQLGNDNGVTNNDTGDYFGMNLGYNNDIGIGNSALYNGNIGGITWSHLLGTGTVKEKAYTYDYDMMNRLTGSYYKEKASSWTAPANNGFDERGFTYDLNGNITKLTRFDKAVPGFMDSLIYNYGTGIGRSNKLLAVTDHGDDHKGFKDGNSTGNDYTYDANGNMTRDLNKGIGASATDAANRITYNYLNLPETVTKAGNTIRYIYDATGRKLAQALPSGTVTKQTDYVGEFTYENDALQFINHEEGRMVTASSELIYQHNGETTEGLTASNAVIALETLNGIEKYVKVTASGNTANTGVYPIGGNFPVTKGERYRIRAKGYRTGSMPAYIAVKVNSVFVDWPGAALPSGATTESWVEQIITVPANGTLQAGVAWNVTTNGESLYLNEFEIVKLQATSPEYQYHLKDHLGNVRLTFTTKQEVESNTATLEPAHVNDEQSKFIRYDNARLVSHYLFDKSNGSAPTTVEGRAQRLSGRDNEVFGLAKTLSVMPGDVVKMEVYAKYVDTNSNNWTQALNTLLGQIAGGTAAPGTVATGEGYNISTSTFPYAAGLNGTTTSTGAGPKAYLNWLVFDRDYNFIVGASGYKQMTNAPREYGQDVGHEKLEGTVTISEPGYVYIYLSNENETPVDVFFDDFKVEHIKSPVVQVDDYYAFGGEFTSFQRENSEPNRYKFNGGSELVDDLGIEVYQTQYRMYDPWAPRWWQIDPKTEGQESWSPYHYSFNNPIRYNDPKGDCPPGTPCFGLLNLAIADATAHPDGVGAHTLGVAQGLQNSATGLVNAVTHPGETLQGLGNLALAGLAGNPASALQMDAALGTNSYGTMMGVSQAVANGADNLINGNGIQRGTVIGEIGGAVFGSKGLSAGLRLGGNALSVGLKSVTTSEGFLFGSVSMKAPFNIPVQRFGAMSVSGESAFGLRTGSSTFAARTFNAILPKWNNLTNYTIGTIPKGTGIRLGITAPQGLKFPGGFPQINVKPRLVINQSSRLVN